MENIVNFTANGIQIRKSTQTDVKYTTSREDLLRLFFLEKHSVSHLFHEISAVLLEIVHFPLFFFTVNPE